jgi:hypothetical protein
MWKAQKPQASHITTAPATTAFHAYFWGFYVSLVILNENRVARGNSTFNAGGSQHPLG